ncbi:MAG: class I SAM-dependent methyltransferase [Rhodospirillaceae bacterium]|mgnify:CR=1 FL=1|jgi:SAM-dependent methyltransferase|nr:class I SAM-dependent methyltransferase [Rhodospirillaceae bacterium]MBT4588694.1 class I SAM-dependent methyltransferase [Rhodospirillaceae bacterium]MBT4938401.1 class I SAM-dependent methyltransferase [Rhodospirillaceae bacterium]MBT5938979.1 class I SAM-dependent methyltransferase [Rhodospirillaceae bacterium]MBT7267952.1 class I SAM-dependent methyltransferase [Rhodospirillaceae bacterium]
MINKIRGTTGYTEQAEQLFERYENIPFEEVHIGFLDLMPTSPGLVLDIGSGTGRDAAYFADKGHRVVAVEPTDELRIPAAQLHPSPAIEWINDQLPTLDHVATRGERFDLIMLTAVWMHLDDQERQRAMPILASLLQPGGVMIMSLRHGPTPPGRQMFDVSAKETIRLAEAAGLSVIKNTKSESTQSANRKKSVMWSKLAFRIDGKK